MGGEKFQENFAGVFFFSPLPHLLQSCCRCWRGGSPSCQRRQKKLCVASRSRESIKRRKCVHGAVPGTICGLHRASSEDGCSCVKHPFLDSNGLFCLSALLRRRVTVYVSPDLGFSGDSCGGHCIRLCARGLETHQICPLDGWISGHWRHETVCHLRASAGKSKEQLVSALLGFPTEPENVISGNPARPALFRTIVQKENRWIQVICPLGSHMRQIKRGIVREN